MEQETNIIILLDTSVHMRFKYEKAISRCLHFYYQYENAQNIFVIRFDSSAELLCSKSDELKKLENLLPGTLNNPCAFFDSVGNQLYEYIKYHGQERAIFILLSEGIDDCSRTFDFFSWNLFLTHVIKNYNIEWIDYTELSLKTYEYGPKQEYTDHEYNRNSPLFSGNLSKSIWEKILSKLRI